MMPKLSWPPDFRLPDYSGPYPRRELEASRKELIDILTAPPFSIILERVKPLIGISSSFGTAQPLPPLPKKFHVHEPEAGTSQFPAECNISSGRQNVSVGGQNMSFRKQNHGGHNMSMGYQNISGGELNTSLNTSGGSWKQSSSPNISLGPSPSMQSFAAPLMSSPYLQSTPLNKQKLAHRAKSSFNLRDSGCFDDSGWKVDSLDDRSCRSEPQTLSSVHDSSNSGVSSLLSPDAILPIASKSQSSFSSQKRKLSIADSDSLETKRPRCDSVGDQYSSPALSPDSTQYELVYKCDFCQFNTKIPHQMETHLTNAKHFSGSLYNAICNPVSGNKLISVEKMLAFKNPYSMTKALIVACPDCREIFEDIFMCAMHHKFIHGSVNGCYAICPIIRHETVSFSQLPECAECGAHFPKHKDLHAHWNAIPEHHPLKQPTKPNIFVIYICPYCSKIFYKNFLSCKNHVLGHNRTSARYALEVKHVLQPLKSHDLPPFNTAPGNKDGLENELTILKNMRNFYIKDMFGSKGKGRSLNHRISTLKMMLKQT